MLKNRCSVVLVSALVVAGLTLVPAPGIAWSGWGFDLSFEWTAVWSQWFGGSDQPAISAKTGSAIDPDGTPDDDDDNPSNDPPAAAAAQCDPPGVAATGGV